MAVMHFSSSYLDHANLHVESLLFCVFSYYSLFVISCNTAGNLFVCEYNYTPQDKPLRKKHFWVSLMEDEPMFLSLLVVVFNLSLGGYQCNSHVRHQEFSFPTNFDTRSISLKLLLSNQQNHEHQKYFWNVIV